jgi:hypothetical protein
MSDIPPVISCAVCGLSSCEGCKPREVEMAGTASDSLPWETKGPALGTLLETAISTTLRARPVFATLGGRAPRRALAFALAAELAALGSILIALVVTLLTLAPRFTIAVLSLPHVWALCSSLWLVTALLVVSLHVLWAELLERGIRRSGGTGNSRLALDFAGYSCGWDLLTSPLGIWLSVRHGARSGEPLTRALFSAVRAPGPAVQAYLVECRQLDAKTAARVHRGAIWRALLIVSLGAVLAAVVLVGVLVTRA